MRKDSVFLPARSDSDTLEAGCDEAGRGPLAGPVFAAAVILPAGFRHPLLNDSKQMSPRSREELREIIESQALACAVVAVTAEEIDRINILNASITAMWRAVVRLAVKPEALIVDGNRFRNLDRLPNSALEERFGEYSRSEAAEWRLKDCLDTYKGLGFTTFVKGDGRFGSIAAASVLAKTYRDDYMRRIAAEYPQYGWDSNMGYPTPEHIEAIRHCGYSPYHRRTFSVKELESSLF